MSTPPGHFSRRFQYYQIRYFDISLFFTKNVPVNLFLKHLEKILEICKKVTKYTVDSTTASVLNFNKKNGIPVECSSNLSISLVWFRSQLVNCQRWDKFTGNCQISLSVRLPNRTRVLHKRILPCIFLRFYLILPPSMQFNLRPSSNHGTGGNQTLDLMAHRAQQSA